MAAAGTSSKGDMDLGCWCVHGGLFLPLSLPSCRIFLYVLYIFEGLFTWYGTSLDNQKFAVEVAINESNGRTVKASVTLHLYDGRPAEWRH